MGTAAHPTNPEASHGVSKDVLDSAMLKLSEHAQSYVGVDLSLEKEAVKAVLQGASLAAVVEASGKSHDWVYRLVRVVGRRYRVRGELLVEDGGELDVPDGWRGEPGMNSTVLRDVASICQHGSLDEVDAVVEQQYASHVHGAQSSFLTYPLVYASWKLVQFNKVIEMAEDVHSLPPSVARSVSTSYFALEAARSESAHAYVILRRVSKITDGLVALAESAAPLAEASVHRLLQVLDDPEATEGNKRAALRAFQATPPVYIPDSIRGLSEGQLHRLIESLGVRNGRCSQREQVEAERKLTELGLLKDAPWARPMWFSAYACGGEDLFWSGMQKLAAGNPGWQADLLKKY